MTSPSTSILTSSPTWAVSLEISSIVRTRIAVFAGTLKNLGVLLARSSGKENGANINPATMTRMHFIRVSFRPGWNPTTIRGRVPDARKADLALNEGMASALLPCVRGHCYGIISAIRLRSRNIYLPKASTAWLKVAESATCNRGSRRGLRLLLRQATVRSRTSELRDGGLFL